MLWPSFSGADSDMQLRNFSLPAAARSCAGSTDVYARAKAISEACRPSEKLQADAALLASSTERKQSTFGNKIELKDLIELLHANRRNKLFIELTVFFKNR